jgi:hypothetical protein
MDRSSRITPAIPGIFFAIMLFKRFGDAGLAPLVSLQRHQDENHAFAFAQAGHCLADNGA